MVLHKPSTNCEKQAFCHYTVCFSTLSTEFSTANLIQFMNNYSYKKQDFLRPYFLSLQYIFWIFL